MPTMLAVLVYLAAMGVPVFLLYRFHSQPWYWHLLAVCAAVAMGLVPIPPRFQTAACDLLFGSVCVALLIWGAGGLIVYRTHHHRHA